MVVHRCSDPRCSVISVGWVDGANGSVNGVDDCVGQYMLGLLTRLLVIVLRGSRDCIGALKITITNYYFAANKFTLSRWKWFMSMGKEISTLFGNNMMERKWVGEQAILSSGRRAVQKGINEETLAGAMNHNKLDVMKGLKCLFPSDRSSKIYIHDW